MTELCLIFSWLQAVTAQRLADVRADEGGEVTEKTILVAVFAALAIAASAIIVAKVLAKANSISLN